MNTNRLIFAGIIFLGLLVAGWMLYKDSFTFYTSPNALRALDQYAQNTKPLENHTPLSSATHNLIQDVNSGKDLEILMTDTFPIIIKFYADWCGACKYVQTFFPALAKQFEGKVHFYSVNSDNGLVMKALQESPLIKEPIQYLPTFVLARDGKTLEQVTGAQELPQLIEHISTIFGL